MRKLSGETYLVNIDDIDVAITKPVLKNLHDAILDAHGNLDKVRAGYELNFVGNDFHMIVFNFEDSVRCYIILKSHAATSRLGTAIMLSFDDAISFFYSGYESIANS